MTATKTKRTVALIGGPDVDARIDLMQFLSARFDVFAVGSASEIKSSFDASGFRYFLYPLVRTVNPVADLRVVWNLVRLLRRERPAIVHAFDTKPCVFARMAAWLAGVPVIIGTMPGLGTLYSPGQEGGVLRSALRQVYEMGQRVASRLSDITILQNPEDASFVESKGIVPSKKVRLVLGSGVRTDLFDPGSRDAESVAATRTELGAVPETVLVIMVARLVRSKGVMQYVDAAIQLLQTNKNVMFILVGYWDQAGPDCLSEEEMGRLSGAVDWLGERRDMVDLLAASDICVLPTYYGEGIPRVLLEGAAMGLPLVATDMPGCREVVNDGENGYLVAPQDSIALASAIGELAHDPSLRTQFGAASRILAVTRFDSKAIAQQIQGLYFEAIENKMSTTGNSLDRP